MRFDYRMRHLSPLGRVFGVGLLVGLIGLVGLLVLAPDDALYLSLFGAVALFAMLAMQAIWLVLGRLWIPKPHPFEPFLESIGFGITAVLVLTLPPAFAVWAVATASASRVTAGEVAALALWCIASAGIGFGATAGIGLITRRRGAAPGRCPSCDYSTHGLPGPTCPECGGKLP